MSPRKTSASKIRIPKNILDDIPTSAFRVKSVFSSLTPEQKISWLTVMSDTVREFKGLAASA